MTDGNDESCNHTEGSGPQLKKEGPVKAHQFRQIGWLEHALLLPCIADRAKRFWYSTRSKASSGRCNLPRNFGTGLCLL